MSTARKRLAAPACTAAAAMSILLLSSCSQSSDDHTKPSPSRAGTISPSGPSSTPDGQLIKRATSVVASVPGGALLEGGSERVKDGIHTRPVLREGKAYRLVLACVGQGRALLTVVPKKSGADAVIPCDQAVVQQRIKGHGPVHIDVVGSKGTTGALAWRINEL
ncbi:hypothetical protein SAMN05428944_0273 [Streptomyces sp. 1222.5]|uniref:hypothetical protein n=1 Tax=unclassified Streptomyces TaxID=2593676 RepID=UPI000894CA81|nr:MULTISPECIES: hypothetical protein [unclassified Streptomyces]PKW12463.1 hypothetical protein BX260_7822 [Streptomyces sp. 5112.2]SEB55999.1 hypothetical protein SAMN05428944_0273 [Streptomyces sp. 1222.5]